MPVRKIDVVAVEPLEARDGVGRDRLVGVADMRRAVGIGDRGRDVIGGLSAMELRILVIAAERSESRIIAASAGLTVVMDSGSPLRGAPG